MATRSLMFAALFLSFIFMAFGQENCTADGGYDDGAPCVGSCRDFESDPPFIGRNTPPEAPEFANDTTWCATSADYNPDVPVSRKKWGFCFCEDNSTSFAPSGAPTFSPTTEPGSNFTFSPTISNFTDNETDPGEYEYEDFPDNSTYAPTSSDPNAQGRDTNAASTYENKMSLLLSLCLVVLCILV